MHLLTCRWRRPSGKDPRAASWSWEQPPAEPRQLPRTWIQTSEWVWKSEISLWASRWEFRLQNTLTAALSREPSHSVPDFRTIGLRAYKGGLSLATGLEVICYTARENQDNMQKWLTAGPGWELNTITDIRAHCIPQITKQNRALRAKGGNVYRISFFFF